MEKCRELLEERKRRAKLEVDERKKQKGKHKKVERNINLSVQYVNESLRNTRRPSAAPGTVREGGWENIEAVADKGLKREIRETDE